MTLPISLITVSYNSAATLPRLLASVPAGVEVWLVDNSSKDGSVDVARSFGAQVIQLDENIGFGAASNRGAKAATQKYLYFANPDSILTPGSLETMLAVMQEQNQGQGDNIVALNPAFYSPSGEQHFKRRSVLLPRNLWMRPSQGQGSGRVCVLSGAGLFLEKARFDQVGGFDEQIFLFHEDDDLSLRLATFGSLYLAADAKVFHQQGTGSERSPKTGYQKSTYLARSKAYVLTKYQIPNVRLRLFAEMVMKLLNPLIFFSPWRRARALGFAKGYRTRKHKPEKRR